MSGSPVYSRVLPQLILLLAACVPAVAVEIRGTVLSAVERKPLKRAEVVLRPANPGSTAVGVITDDKGQFAFFDLTAGRYSLSVSRNDYLPTTAAYYNQVRLGSPFQLDRSLAEVTVRMLPACVVSGRVRHSDGEPAVGITVEAYREYFRRNQHGYQVAGRARSNDRGEYRLFSLPPGRYYFSAVAVPFNGNDDIEEQPARDAYGQRVPPERTVTTFLSSSLKATGATQMSLAAGDVVESADIFLVKSRTVTIPVRTMHGGTGQPLDGAAVSLLREDVTGGGNLPAHAVIRPKGKGQFEIRGVVPDAYAIEVRASERGTFLYSRRPLLVGEASPPTVDLLAQPEIVLRGVTYTADRDQKVTAGMRVLAEPRNEGPPPRSAQIGRDGTFEIRLVAGQMYDLILASTPRNVYLKSATLDGVDVLARGLTVPTATQVPLTLTMDERGAEVQGETQPGATVSLIPLSGLSLRFSETAANEWGIFGFAAVAPGDYYIVAWLDEPPCDPWNPDRRAECGRFGQRLTIDAASSYTLSLEP